MTGLEGSAGLSAAERGTVMKKALVSGASRGIGRACAEALSADGFRVVVNYRENREKAGELARRIGGEAIGADVSDPTAVKRMFDAAGDIDALVCNAGIALQKLFTDTSYEEWRRIFAVNVDGAYNLIRAALPHMIHEKRGRIVIVSSVWGVRGASCEVAYSASKAALTGLTRALAKELGPSGITVNCVAPGVIDTDMNAALDTEALAELADETPLCRLGTPEEVAEVVSFLCSEKAGFVTGQIIGVDGGFGM